MELHGQLRSQIEFGNEGAAGDSVRHVNVVLSLSMLKKIKEKITTGGITAKKGLTLNPPLSVTFKLLPFPKYMAMQKHTNNARKI